MNDSNSTLMDPRLTTSPGLVYWYHNQDMLEYEGRVAITTVEDPTGLRSQLTIEEATPSHSGNYTC